MRHKAPDNEAKLSLLLPQEQAEYRNYLVAMDKIERTNPQLDTSVYTDWRKLWIDQAVVHGDAMREMQNATTTRPDGQIVPKYSKFEIRRKSAEIRQQTTDKLMHETLPKYDAKNGHARQAIQELAEETQPSIFTAAARNVYHKNEGGIQWGGLIGAIGGVLLGSTLGGGMGSWMGIVALIAGAIGGSWLGNKIGDSMKSKTESSLDSTPSRSPSQARGQQQEVEAEIPESERIKAARASATKPFVKKKDEEQQIIDLPTGTNVAPVYGPPVADEPQQQGPKK